VIEQHGLLAPGEMYGLMTASQLGGSYSIANLRRVQAIPYLMNSAKKSTLQPCASNAE
jgi:hypothetical protein